MPLASPASCNADSINKEGRFKDLARLASRAPLVNIKRYIEKQIRGPLKTLGLVIGQAKMNVFALRVAELTRVRLELAAAVTPQLTARMAIEADVDRKVMKLATQQCSSATVRGGTWHRSCYGALLSYND